MGDTRKKMGKILSKIGDVPIPGTGHKYKKELKLAEEQFQAIFEYTGTGMLVIAPDLTIIHANRKASEISGYPHSILQGTHKWTEFIGDETELKRLLSYRERRYAGDQTAPIQYETSMRHADGSRRHLLVNVSQIPGSDNILSSFSDITDLYTVHTMLLESERRFKETAELLPVIICEFDKNMEFTYVNQLGFQIFGYTPEDIEKKRVNFTDFFLPDEIPHLIESVNHRWQDHTKGPEEYRMTTASGERRDFLIISSVIPGEKEDVGLRSCLVDITDFKRVEKELVESEKRLRAIYDSSPIGITVLNGAGIPLEMNRAFRALFQVDDHPVPSLFTILDIDPARLNGESQERLCGFRLVQSDESETLTAVKTDSVCYSWHITPLEESGGSHYLCQVIDITERVMAERKRIEEAELMVEGLRKKITLNSSFENIISRSPALQTQFDMLPTIAGTGATLLITGESGTGKELLAQTVHQISDRKDKPFVAINCGALPETLLESELFGHKAGAFTDAKADRKGKFLAADGGTIFLDELGEISSPMQVKLLRVLQERSFQPLGSDKTVTVDVRVIAATNRDLAAMVKEGTFREDLYYRIKVLHLHLPPLRDRREDIPLLCDHFISIYNAKYGKEVNGLTPEALDLLLGFSFPGNIRELQNVLEHAFIFCTGSRIEPRHLPEELRGGDESVTSADGISLDSIGSFDELEGLWLRHMIEKNGGNKTETAHALGMHKATMFRKLRKLGIN